MEGSRPWGSCWVGNNFIISYPELTDKDASNRLSVSCRSLQTQAIAGIKKEVLYSPVALKEKSTRQVVIHFSQSAFLARQSQWLSWEMDCQARSVLGLD